MGTCLRLLARGFARPLAAAAAALLTATALSACGGSVKTKTVAAPTAPQKQHATGNQRAAGDPASTQALQSSYIRVIARVSPEVVQISTPKDLGSGIVFDNHGDVVTNNHVIASGGPFVVTDSHGRRYHATLVGHFVPDDLAVVHAQGASLRPAAFANTRKLRVGDMVLALGNPLGLRSSVTSGIVSALGRTVSEPNGAVLPNVIQTSAPINPGNSGGALVDLQGKVVGIPTLAATDPQLGGGAAPGIGFAIPSSVVSNIARQIVKHGHVVSSHRAFLGVSLATGVANRAIVIAVTPGGPAAKAGIKPGEAIVSIDGHKIAGVEGAATVLAKLAPGRTVSVGIITAAGAQRTVHVRLGQYPGGG